jgi:predicted dehydrogenase
MPTPLNRRSFLRQTTAAAAAGGYFVSHAAAQDSTSPNERLNIAAVGTTGRAGANIAGVSSQNIVALADVDSALLEKGSARYPSARKYADFRVMLEKEVDKIDALVVATPDHTHAPAAAMGLRLNKPVYCEKPLTHTLFEARTLADLAKENKLITQMGNQIHSSENYRQVVELVQSGVIGAVAESHVWAAAVYKDAKFKNAPKPANLNWDLWLGPAAERPYSEGVHPFKWRSFWDYGAGTLGDFGCHYLDLAHWALDLTAPTHVRAKGPKADLVSAPDWLIVDYKYPARGDKPAVDLTWYDSGKRPEKQLAKLEPILSKRDGKPVGFRSGQMFVGEKGVIISDYGRHYVVANSGEVLLAHDNKKSQIERPEKTVARSIGHHAEWLSGIRTGKKAGSDFSYAGPLTEAVMLGVMSHRSGEAFDWNAKTLTASSKKAQAFMHIEYRKGWTL